MGSPSIPTALFSLIGLPEDKSYEGAFSISKYIVWELPSAQRAGDENHLTSHQHLILHSLEIIKMAVLKKGLYQFILKIYHSTCWSSICTFHFSLLPDALISLLTSLKSMTNFYNRYFFTAPVPFPLSLNTWFGRITILVMCPLLHC